MASTSTKAQYLDFVSSPLERSELIHRPLKRACSIKPRQRHTTKRQYSNWRAVITTFSFCLQNFSFCSNRELRKDRNREEMRCVI
jgi:hypothetical protein